MRWTVHGERPMYSSEWVSVVLADVEVPEVGEHRAHRFEHHVVRMPAPAAGVVVYDPDRGVLLLWRHRFIVDRWGWEVPAGKVDLGESPATAAAREVLEETGWRCEGQLELLTEYSPVSGVGDHRFFLYLARSVTPVGAPTDPAEAERIEWVPVERLRTEMAAGNIDNGLTLTALLWCMAHGIF